MSLIAHRAPSSRRTPLATRCPSRRDSRTHATRAALVVVASLALAGAAAAQAPERLGSVNFPTSCAATVQPQFDRAVALLHSFWFGEAIKAFDAVAQADPSCGIAHWGAAVAWLGNPLGGPPTPRGLQEGSAAVARAKAAGARTPREQDYIAAIEAFYKDHATVDHRTRALAYEKAMEGLARKNPQDREAAIFYALALNITLNPNDKAYTNQLKAAGILETVFAEQPNHPGVAHYLIHSYDFPPIAGKGEPAARRYATIAPSAPHALHMPSHIFTRLGYWQDSIDTNRRSVDAAKDELRQANLDAGSYNALHAMDYIVYAGLQLARDRETRGVVDEVRRIDKIDSEQFAAAFAFAAIPARYALERRQWAEAVELPLHPPSLSWPKFPQAESVVVFARGLGGARGGNLPAAKSALARLETLRDALSAAKNGYWAEQAEIQRLAVAGWIARAEGRNDEALALLRQAADREDGTEKHPVTPGAIQPAREMLGELLIELGQPAAALAAFEASQKADPNRLHGLAGAARAAELAGDRARAKAYAERLLALTKTADTERPEVARARAIAARN
jgi:tetratricopeptide (TPR) repeat protein